MIVSSFLLQFSHLIFNITQQVIKLFTGKPLAQSAGRDSVPRRRGAVVEEMRRRLPMDSSSTMESTTCLEDLRRSTDGDLHPYILKANKLNVCMHQHSSIYDFFCRIIVAVVPSPYFVA